MHTLEGAGVSVDVQDQLLKERTRKRKPGVIPYPVQYSEEQLVYDNWNNLFLTSLRRSLTMHRSDTPPSTVLDLGCGDGLWIVEAAKTWPTSTFVGFDMVHNQPNLSLKSLGLEGVAERVTWVHGNLLEELPFQSEQFDFVRICCIGLGVPEDEWQYLLEEVARVMVPGGVIEIIEEDLIFPCGPPHRRDDLLDPNFDVHAMPGHGGSSSSLNYSPSQSTSSSTQGLIPLSSGPSSPPRQLDIPNSMDLAYNQPSTQDPDVSLDPQDHSKLKLAWEEMLQSRFLTPRLLSVLPFYMSSCFRNIQTHPTLHIALPPNSHLENGTYISPRQQYDESADISALFSELKRYAVRWSSESRPDNSSLRSKQSSIATISQWASIHLARSVQMIRGCKRAIWDEYRELKTPNDKSDSSSQGEVPSKHDEFEAAWANWENDMKDRMAMRSKLREAFSWDEPPGERPGWRVWRECAGDLELPDTDPLPTPPSLCRSLRSFVGWKPENAAHSL
ncbi:hypothetical protein BKA93DRAFT_818528 [Sparassis latifolia]